MQTKCDKLSSQHDLLKTDKGDVTVQMQELSQTSTQVSQLQLEKNKIEFENSGLKQEIEKLNAMLTSLQSDKANQELEIQNNQRLKSDMEIQLAVCQQNLKRKDQEVESLKKQLERNLKDSKVINCLTFYAL